MKDEENILPHYLYERRAVITSFNFGLPKNLEIPEGIIGIGDGAFTDCPIIESVKIPGSVDFIGEYAFSNCRNLRRVEIGEGVMEIKRGAFRGCRALESIKIPSSVETIDTMALSLSGRNERLSVYYAGSEEQWEKLKFNPSMVTVSYGSTEKTEETDEQ